MISDVVLDARPWPWLRDFSGLGLGPMVLASALAWKVQAVCYSEQYVRLKRNIFSPWRKADVDCVRIAALTYFFGKPKIYM